MDLLCQKEVEWSGSMYQIFIQSNFNFGKFHNYTYPFRINFQFEYITILISYLFSNYEILKRIRTIHRHTSKMKEVRQETTSRVRLLLISLWFHSVMWQTMFHDRSVKCRIWAVKTEVCVFLFYIMNYEYCFACVLIFFLVNSLTTVSRSTETIQKSFFEFVK